MAPPGGQAESACSRPQLRLTIGPHSARSRTADGNFLSARLVVNDAMVGIRLSLACALLVGCLPGAPTVPASTRAAATAAPTPDVWSELRRALSPVGVSPDGACAYSRGRAAWQVPGAVGFTPGIRGYVAWGDGPVRPAFYATSDEAILSFSKMPKDRRDGSAIEKIIWIVEPGHAGRLLVRAVSSDGARRATFMTGDELRLEVGDSGGTFPEGLVQFPAPACYTFQIEGSRGTSRVVVWVGE